MKKNTAQIWLFRGLLAALLTACVLGAIGFFKFNGPRSGDNSVIDMQANGGSPVGGPFTLMDMNGAAVTEKSWPDQYKLIYFGFTYCPDLCPTAMQTVANVMDQLGPAADKLQPIMITVDPKRDTAAVLRDYLAQFHPKIIGLTGDENHIASVAKSYHVYFSAVPEPDGTNAGPEYADDYLVDHTDALFFMAPDGQFITAFSGDITADAMTKTIQQHIKP